MIIELDFKIKLEFHTYDLLVLNKNNADIIEKIIENHTQPAGKRAHDTFVGAFAASSYSNKAICGNIIKDISSSNSTHTSRVAINEFCNYILDSKNNFWDRLKNGDIDLPDDMAKYVESKCGRNEKSLASKICKYFSQWRYSKDNYFINDSIVRSVLPAYLLKHKIIKKGTLSSLDDYSYHDLHCLLDSLLVSVNKSSSVPLTKHELDHLLWYVYKLEFALHALAVNIGKEAYK